VENPLNATVCCVASGAKFKHSKHNSFGNKKYRHFCNRDYLVVLDSVRTHKSSAKFLCLHNGDKIFSFIQELNFYKLFRLISDITELLLLSTFTLFSSWVSYLRLLYFLLYVVILHFTKCCVCNGRHSALPCFT